MPTARNKKTSRRIKKSVPPRTPTRNRIVSRRKSVRVKASSHTDSASQYILRVGIIAFTGFILLTGLVTFSIDRMLTKLSSLSGHPKTNIVLLATSESLQDQPQIAVLSLDQYEKTASWLIVPNTLNWPTTIEQTPAILAQQLGILSNDWIAVSSFSDMKSPQQVAKLLQDHLFNIDQTSLSVADQYLLWKQLRFLSNEQIHRLSLESSNLINYDVDAQSYQVNQSECANWIKENYFQTLIRERNLTVAVVNGTQINGLAARIGEVLANTGFLLVNTSSAEQLDISKSRILVQDEWLTTATELDLVNSLFVESLPIIYDEQVPRRYRSDIVIIVGEDMELDRTLFSF